MTNGERGSAEGNVIILIVSRYRFDISNRFRSDRREFASDCDTYATRYEIRKKRGQTQERRRRHQTSLTGSRVIQKTLAGLSVPTDDDLHCRAERPDFSIIHQEPRAGRHAIDFLLISCGLLLGINRTL